MNKHVGAGHSGAILPSSVISLCRLGGPPDLRAPCIFGPRLNGYNPLKGPIVAFHFTLALVEALRAGKNPAPDQRVGKFVAACPKTRTPPEVALSKPQLATAQTPHVEMCCQA